MTTLTKLAVADPTAVESFPWGGRYWAAGMLCVGLIMQISEFVYSLCLSITGQHLPRPLRRPHVPPPHDLNRLAVGLVVGRGEQRGLDADHLCDLRLGQEAAATLVEYGDHIAMVRLLRLNRTHTRGGRRGEAAARLRRRRQPAARFIRRLKLF